MSLEGEQYTNAVKKGLKAQGFRGISMLKLINFYLITIINRHQLNIYNHLN
jgi:hypothetical protein